MGIKIKRTKHRFTEKQVLAMFEFRPVCKRGYDCFSVIFTPLDKEMACFGTVALCRRYVHLLYLDYIDSWVKTFL